MSKWTGKCDFADHCEMINNPQKIIENANVYMGNAKLAIKEPRDLIPYYTNIIGMMSSSNGHQEIHLALNSFIDDEEADMLSWRIYHAIKAARKCKKSKIDFTIDSLKEQLAFDAQIDAWLMTIDIIKDEPDLIKIHLPTEYRKALRVIERDIVPHYFFDVHLDGANRKREEFVKYAAENGYKTFENQEGEYHPLIWHMCWSIQQYKDMKNKYKEK